MPGTDKQFTEVVNWIPMSLKIEKMYGSHSWGMTINVLNNQAIYDAMWQTDPIGKPQLHHFEYIYKRASFLARFNGYMINNERHQLYFGIGWGFAIRTQHKKVSPNSYEFDGSGEMEFLEAVGMEISGGYRLFPFKNKKLGFLLEGGLMQSLGRFGLTYKFVN